MMPALVLDLSNETYSTAAVMRANFVHDMLVCMIGGNWHEVPFEWTVEATPAAAAAAIDAYLAGAPMEVMGNGQGLIVQLGSLTHPAAEATGADFEHGLLEFRWIKGPHNGDCAISMEWSLESSAADIVTALLATIP